MTEPMLPERLKELMAGYVLGNLSSEEAEELRQLIAEHPELSAEVNRLQEVLELMPYALPEVAPPLRLRSVILAATDSPVQSEPTPKRYRLPGKNITSSIAALLVLALGVDNYRLRQQASTMQTQIEQQKDVIAMLQNSKTHLVSLKGMNMAVEASGSIVMTPGEPKVVLILKNLPVLPEGQFYQLWAVVDGEKVPSGQFNATTQGKVLVKLPIPPSSEVEELVVTVEASPTPESPAGPMVLISTS